MVSSRQICCASFDFSARRRRLLIFVEQPLDPAVIRLEHLDGVGLPPFAVSAELFLCAFGRSFLVALVALPRHRFSSISKRPCQPSRA